jgi:hypothetical protein
MKYLLTSAIIASSLMISACGSDSNNNSASNEDKVYSGYIPKFGTAYLNTSPQAVTQVNSALSNKSTILMQATLDSTDSSDTEEENTSITITPINCQESTEIFNTAPQANNFSNSALDFIRNLQAQTNSDDCIMRKQVLENKATVVAENGLTTINSSLVTDTHNNHTIWQIPSEHRNNSSDLELLISARGTLLNLQSGDSNTRIDLLQQIDDQGLFTKIIRSTLLTPSEVTTNIRTALVMEVKDKDGNLITQRMGGRIIFDNKISVIAAVIIPNVGAISYIKQCDGSTAATNDDYMRDCNEEWHPLAYDKDWNLQTDPAAIANLLTLTSVTTEGNSVMDEVTFFFGQSESDFFTDQTLPAIQ